MRKISIIVFIIILEILCLADNWDEYDLYLMKNNEITKNLNLNDSQREIIYSYLNSIYDSDSAIEYSNLTIYKLEELLEKFKKPGYEIDELYFAKFLHLVNTWNVAYYYDYYWNYVDIKTGLKDNSKITWNYSKRDVVTNFYKEAIPFHNLFFNLNWDGFYRYWDTKKKKYKKRTENDAAVRIYNAFYKENSRDIFTENYYRMIRDYRTERNLYFYSRAKLEELRSILYRDYDKNYLKIKILNKYQENLESCFRNVDFIARLKIFDLPLNYAMNYENIYATALMYGDFGKVNSKNQNLMKRSALNFAKISPLIGYTVHSNTHQLYINTQKKFKNYLGENLYNEIADQSKLEMQWLKVLPKIEIN